MRLRLPLLLLALLAIGSCDPGIQTQVIIHYRTNYLEESAALVRVTSFREDLDDIIVERSLLGPDAEAMFPLTVPVHPLGGDSTRRFRVEVVVVDAEGNTLHRRQTIGGFEEGKRLEVVVRLDENCGGMRLCGAEQTCVMGACRAACVLPVEQEGRDETPSISCAAFRKRISLQLNVNAAVERLPVVVSLTDPDLIGKVDDEGADIAFADMSGAALPHELVAYDAEDGSLIAWVLVPEIRPGDATEFFMYFGGASAPVDPGAVWSGFEGVWHLDGENGIAVDQSSLSNELTSSLGERPSVEGVVHRAQDFRGEREGDPDDLEARRYVFGAGGNLRGFDFSASDSISFSVWANIRNLDSGDRFIYGGASGVPGFLLSTAAGDLRDAQDVRYLVGPSDDIPEGEWTLVTLVVDRETNRASLYRNGMQDADWRMPDISDLGAPAADPPFLVIGGSGGCCFIDGLLDEVWVERAAWSQTRVRAMYDNQSDPRAVEVGELETLR